jgi:hypothetical protein
MKKTYFTHTVFRRDILTEVNSESNVSAKPNSSSEMCLSDSDSGQTSNGLNNPRSGTTGACIHPCESSERSSSAGLNNPEVKSTSGLNNNQESHNHPCSKFSFEGRF